MCNSKIFIVVHLKCIGDSPDFFTNNHQCKVKTLVNRVLNHNGHPHFNIARFISHNVVIINTHTYLVRCFCKRWENPITLDNLNKSCIIHNAQCKEEPSLKIGCALHKTDNLSKIEIQS